jgi:hypothetical protein
MNILHKSLLLGFVLACATCGFAQQSAHLNQSDIRGWLSDEGCARGRAEGGTYTATNVECAKNCVAKGKKVVLVDPERKMIFDIANQGAAKENVGDYVEIIGQIDLQAKIIRVGSLKLLERGTASCERPKLSN